MAARTLGHCAGVRAMKREVVCTSALPRSRVLGLDEPHPHRRYRWSDQTRSSSIFAAAAAAVWVAGIWLSRMTDVLALRFHLGEALAGAILLAVTTNLPEIAITVTVAIEHNIEIAIGNILGGIAIQTVALAVIDAVGLGTRSALTYLAAPLQLVLEGAIVIAVLVATIMGTQFGAHGYFGRVEPAALNIALIWVIGLWLVRRANQGLPRGRGGAGRTGARERDAQDGKEQRRRGPRHRHGECRGDLRRRRGCDARPRESSSNGAARSWRSMRA
jgi:hypothetical protein